MAIVSHVMADRLGIGLGDDPTIDRLDDAARTLVLARGPLGSADLVREHVNLARQQRNTQKDASE
ncbi:hypothetical protein [Streptomyces lincolnensis]|uniref:hypothetical protein n=1 Tax=Streptomyces lincolnensis TaxID=1915 RepID=UPI0008350675|nr:hypothetical protein [Streptomyces lincolnensis]